MTIYFHYNCPQEFSLALCYYSGVVVLGFVSNLTVQKKKNLFKILIICHKNFSFVVILDGLCHLFEKESAHYMGIDRKGV